MRNPLPERVSKYGREDRIRTCDPYVPNVVRYRAALLPDGCLTGGRVPKDSRRKTTAASGQTGRKNTVLRQSGKIDYCLF